MKRDIGKPVFDLVLIVASGAAFALSNTLDSVEVPGDLSPSFFPKMLSALIFILAIPCLVRDIREWDGANESSGDGKKKNGIWQWLFIVAVTVVYIQTFEVFGYIGSTVIFTSSCVLGLLFISGAWREMEIAQRLKSIFFAIIFSAILAVSVFYVFTDFFEIPLPIR